MPYDPNHRWDGTCRHGAGLSALAALGSRFGYELVGCDSHGVNVFFVVSSEAEHFSRRSVRGHYVGPRYALPFGHPRRRFGPFEAEPVPEDEARLVQLNIAPSKRNEVRPSGLVYVHATVENGAKCARGEFPFDAGPTRRLVVGRAQPARCSRAGTVNSALAGRTGDNGSSRGSRRLPLMSQAVTR